MSRVPAPPILKFGLGLSYAKDAPAWPERLAAAILPRLHAPAGVTLEPLTAVVDRRSRTAVERALKSFGSPADGLAVAHQEAATPFVLNVPAGQRYDFPAVLDCRLSGQTAQTVVIVAGAGSRLTVVEHDLTVDDTAAGRSARLVIVAGEGAEITFIRLQDAAATAWDWHAARAFLAAEAKLTFLEAIFGGDFCRSDLLVSLAGERAECRTRTIAFAAGRQKVVVTSRVDHDADGTVSDMRARTAVAGAARTFVRTRLNVKRGTIDTNGRQDLRGLILGKEAQCAVEPQLEVAAERTACGHAAAVGRLDRDRLFYLATRGLARPEAVRLMATGFFSPLLETMRGAGLEEAAACLIADRLADPAILSAL